MILEYSKKKSPENELNFSLNKVVSSWKIKNFC